MTETKTLDAQCAEMEALLREPQPRVRDSNERFTPEYKLWVGNRPGKEQLAELVLKLLEERKQQRAEIEAYESQQEKDTRQLAYLERAKHELGVENQRLREALEFYAWLDEDEDVGGWLERMEDEWGDIATIALKGGEA